MKLSIEISEVEVESMSKVATQVVESILNGRTVLARVITESVDRTVAMACCRIDKIVEMQTVDAAARRSTVP